MNLLSATAPIHVLPLFPVLDQRLTELLRSLSPTEWQRPTLARQWTVKDVAAHLLDGNLRSLSMLRDGYFREAPADPNSYDGLVTFLNGLNADWVRAPRRLSPRLDCAIGAVGGRIHGFPGYARPGGSSRFCCELGRRN